MKVLRATLIAAVCAVTTTGATASLRDAERSNQVTVVVEPPAPTVESTPAATIDSTLVETTVATGD